MDKMYQSKLLLYTENRSLQIVAMVTCSPGLPPWPVAMVTYNPCSKTHMMVAMVTPIKNMAPGVSEKTSDCCYGDSCYDSSACQSK